MTYRTTSRRGTIFASTIAVFSMLALPANALGVGGGGVGGGVGGGSSGDSAGGSSGGSAGSGGVGGGVGAGVGAGVGVGGVSAGVGAGVGAGRSGVGAGVGAGVGKGHGAVGAGVGVGAGHTGSGIGVGIGAGLGVSHDHGTTKGRDTAAPTTPVRDTATVSTRSSTAAVAQALVGVVVMTRDNKALGIVRSATAKANAVHVSIELNPSFGFKTETVTIALPAVEPTKGMVTLDVPMRRFRKDLG